MKRTLRAAGVQRRSVWKDEAGQVCTSYMLHGLGHVQKCPYPKSEEKLLETFMREDGSIRLVFGQTTLNAKMERLATVRSTQSYLWNE